MSKDVHDSPLASANIQGGFVSNPTSPSKPHHKLNSPSKPLHKLNSPSKPLPNTIQEQTEDEKKVNDVISSTNGFFALYGTPPPALVLPPDRTSNNIDFINNMKNVTNVNNMNLSSRSRSSSTVNRLFYRWAVLLYL
jgi:hypothetical protein